MLWKSASARKQIIKPCNDLDNVRSGRALGLDAPTMAASASELYLRSELVRERLTKRGQ